jgi:hypothetical protein
MYYSALKSKLLVDWSVGNMNNDISVSLRKRKKKMQLTLNFNWIVETKRKDPSKDPFHKIPFGTFQSNGMN